MWAILTFACGLALGFVGAYARMIWKQRKPIMEIMRKDDSLATARQTLLNITRVPKIEHAHKLAQRTLDEIDG